MIITRKIQIVVEEEDKDLKKEFIHTLYLWRDLVRKMANAITSHVFVQDSVKDFVYLKDEIQEKFYVKDILKEGKGMSETNVTYRLCTDIAKGRVPSSICSCLNQEIRGAVKKSLKDVARGKAALRSYRNNIGIPIAGKTISFSQKAVTNKDGKQCDRYFFTVHGIPLCCMLGRDRSNNEAIIKKTIEGEYKVCGSHIVIDDSSNKMFLLLSLDIPQTKHVLKDKVLYAKLDVNTPIVCATEVNAKRTFDRGTKTWEIGSKEEFLHQRLQIAAAEQRCQRVCKYSRGGHGRKRKLQALDRYAKREFNYISTKLHTYSRELVRLAIKHQCNTIHLVNQKEREAEAKEDEFVLRNWSYYGLKEKITYKAQMNGITVTEE